MVHQLRNMLDVLGMEELLFQGKTATADSKLTDSLLNLLVETRSQAKKAKQFAIADMIRDELAKLEIRLQDHPTGTIWIRD